MDVTRILIYTVALITAVIALNVGGWYAVVRVIDGMGRQLKFHQFVAIRHLRGRKSGFLTLIGLLAIIGVSVSSCTLTTVLSVMGGFSDDLKQKILSTNAHVVIDNYGSDMDKWRPVLEKVRRIPEVKAATPVVQGEVMMNARTNNNGMLLKGVDPASLSAVSQILSKLDEGDIRYINNPELLFQKTRAKARSPFHSALDDPPEPARDDFDSAPLLPRQKVLPTVIVGREMARSLRLFVGDEVNIISPLGDIGPTGVIPRSRPFRVGGSFFSGMYAFDEHYAYTSIKDAQQFLNKGDRISEIHIAVASPELADKIATEISSVLGKQFRVRSWQELNAELFAALKLEKIVMFILLSFAILVASFCIIATLTMLVLEKGSEIAVILTIGATSQEIQRIFRFEGLLIGMVGSITGLIMGLGLCLSLKYIGLPIPPEVWYIDKLPVDISATEFLFVALASLVITTLATIYPTRVAAGISPVEGLKND